MSGTSDDVTGNGRVYWECDPGSGLICCRDAATGLRRYTLYGRRYDEVVPGLFVGPEHWDYAGLRHIVEAVLDLRRMNREEAGPSSRATQAGLEYANFGFDDGCLPPDALICGALEWLRERHGRGTSCLVHCAAGVSRSPFLVCLYLLPRFGWDPERAMRHLVSRRREVTPAKIYIDYLRRWAIERHGGSPGSSGGVEW